MRFNIRLNPAVGPVTVVPPKYSIRREGDEESDDLDRDEPGVRGV